jgi:hypothetical protein
MYELFRNDGSVGDLDRLLGIRERGS